MPGRKAGLIFAGASRFFIQHKNLCVDSAWEIYFFFGVLFPVAGFRLVREKTAF